MAKSHRINFDDLKARADFRAVLLHYGLTPVGQGDQAKGNVLEFVHRMETKDGATVSLREAGLTLASICGIAVEGSE